MRYVSNINMIVNNETSKFLQISVTSTLSTLSGCSSDSTMQHVTNVCVNQNGRAGTDSGHGYDDEDDETETDTVKIGKLFVFVRSLKCKYL
jgi:hypothetical protein